MADSSGRGAGKPATGPTNSSSAKKKDKRVQGGRVIESRYLQYEKKTTQKQIAVGSERVTCSPRCWKGMAQLHLTWISLLLMDLSEAMEMMESQTLLLTLLSVKMENNLAEFERRAEKNLLIMCKEKEKLQEKAHDLKRRLLLSQRKRELADVLDAQIEMLSPFEAVATRFKEQYRTFATALDTTRHELPVRSIHLEGDRQQLLDALQQELVTTQRLLGELDVGDSEENVQVLDLLRELKDVTVKKDLELRRSFAQVLELSAEASKEAALANQEVWEETQGMAPPSRWYFNQDSACRESGGAPKNMPLSEDDNPGALSAPAQAMFISPSEDFSSSSQVEVPPSVSRSGRDLS
ncbi:HAUS8 isoform 5 [Pan troglodytes]|uniref:HAUS8 isoform 5 n=1 Tax=Pan troglodytes TaxID=9598 RepID=A0A2J8LTV5_PANTR|nr:HAUS augmin-like complex subunit 8 isoform X3 [Pan troglodytes]PNI50710.1 HAUS8 isoform 5 [Pan troglodytes]